MNNEVILFCVYVTFIVISDKIFGGTIKDQLFFQVYIQSDTNKQLFLQELS